MYRAAFVPGPLTIVGQLYLCYSFNIVALYALLSASDQSSGRQGVHIHDVAPELKVARPDTTHAGRLPDLEGSRRVIPDA